MVTFQKDVAADSDALSVECKGFVGLDYLTLCQVSRLLVYQLSKEGQIEG